SLRSSASIRGLCRFVIANSAPPGTDGPSFSYRNGAGRLSEKNESALRRSPIVPKSGPRAPLSRTNGPRRSYRECTPGFPVYGGRGEDLRRRTVCYPLLPVEADELARTFEDLRPNLQRKLSALLGNAADAEDALQTAFLRCWQARAAAGRSTTCAAGSGASASTSAVTCGSTSACAGPCPCRRPGKRPAGGKRRTTPRCGGSGTTAFRRRSPSCGRRNGRFS